MSAERPGQRLVGPLWCGDVLAVLSDFVDGGLAAEVRDGVRAHLAGCDECSRFGVEFARVIRALRIELGSAEGPEPEVEARLSLRLAPVLGTGSGGRPSPQGR